MRPNSLKKELLNFIPLESNGNLKQLLLPNIYLTLIIVVIGFSFYNFNCTKSHFYLTNLFSYLTNIDQQIGEQKYCSPSQIWI